MKLLILNGSPRPRGNTAVSSIYHNSSNEKSLQLRTILHDKDQNEFLALRTEGESVTFYLDISFLANYDTTFQIYLLSNFVPIPFSVNDEEQRITHEFHIHAADEISISKNNKICIDGLIYNTNDLCFVFVGKTDIFIKGFQVVNENSDDFLDDQHLQGEIEDAFCSTNGRPYSIFIDENANELCAEFDFVALLNGSRYQEQFVHEGDAFDVLFAAYLEPENAFYHLGVAKVNQKNIKFRVPLNYFSEFDSIRVIAFPFVNQYNDSFLGTYRATLWSSPICTYKVKRESIMKN